MRQLDRVRRSALDYASMSKDPITKVGAVIFSEDDWVEISAGYNCLARGVHHLPSRHERPTKYLYTPHAEANAISNAARMGRATKGASMLVTMFPCACCASLVINSGIKKVYTPEPDWDHHLYREHHEASLVQFGEAGVELVYTNMEV